MGKVVVGAALSLDGFANDRNGSVEPLYPDFDSLREIEIIQESIKNTGAVVMGRRSYEMGQGDFTDYEYQVPIFVLTHNPPPNVARGENEKLSFKFVTTSIQDAIEQAKVAAGGKDVAVVSGADLAQQCLKAGLVDEIQISIMPILLGEGLRFFEYLESVQIQLEKVSVLEAPWGRTDLIFRVVKY